MDEVVKLLNTVIQLEKMASLIVLAIGGALIYTIAYKIPPMVADCLTSVSKSLERISVTMAELVLNTTRICNDTSDHGSDMTKHHENAVALRSVAEGVSEKMDKANDSLLRIETTLNNRPCIK
jgi:hypothetical protein